MGKPDYSQLELPDPPPGRPYVVMNMVMSVDGKAVVGGSEGGLGSDVDHRLMREIRTNADVILVGANTLRATGASSRLGADDLEQVRIASGRPRFPTAALLSRSGELPLDKLFFSARDFNAVIYLTEETPDAAFDAVTATGRPVVRLPAHGTLPAMLAHMRNELGAKILLVEGGPTTNGEFFAGDLVDELFVTVGPVVVGGRDTPTIVEGAHRFTMDNLPRMERLSATLNAATDEVYLRFRLIRG
jgi:2,5-diamino-6-(ribosylamino)-4(3H)-pyrimidinone 5'-phosphate reductase